MRLRKCSRTKFAARHGPARAGAAFAALLTGVVASAGRVAAEPSADDKALATVLFREARALVAQGKVPDACLKFEESRRRRWLQRPWTVRGTGDELRAGCATRASIAHPNPRIAPAARSERLRWRARSLVRTLLMDRLEPNKEPS
jgi:hypothetical protein